MDIINLILMGVIGGYATFLVNSQKAFLQHEVRATCPEFCDQKISRKELFQLAKKSAIPLILGLLIPLSFITKVISLYMLFLLAEMIGLYFHNTLKQRIYAIAIGTAVGLLTYVLLYFLYLWIPPILSLDFMTPLNAIFEPLFAAFAIIPAIAIGIKKGAKKGMSAAVLIIIVYIVLLKAETMQGVGRWISAMSIAFVFGAILYLLLVISKKKEGQKEEVVETDDSYAKIKKNLIYYIILGALLALGSHRLIFSYDPIVQMFIGNGYGLEAGFMMLVLMLSMLPALVTSSLVGGAYSLIGLGGSMVVGYWFSPINNIWGMMIAVVLGAGVALVEVIYLRKFASFSQNSLIVSDMGDSLKKATYLIVDYAILVGSFVAVTILYPGVSPYVGYMWILFFWLLNRVEKNKRINQLVICPVAIVLLGVALNILKLLNLLV
jgi:hypothetical protein